MFYGIDYLVCDLDGTLCDARHRQHLAQAGDWDAFHAGLSEDKPRLAVLSLLKSISEFEGEDKPKIVFLTGRPENYRQQTHHWIKSCCDLYSGDDYDRLLMRGRDEYGSDTIVKQALLEEFLGDAYEGSGMTKQEIVGRVLMLDDRDKVVAHFRDLGYEVWQVNEGAY